jgi:hypothetical protein
MFLNKWTVQLSCPGEVVEQAFDSEEELVAFVRRMESKDGMPPSITVMDPDGKEKLVPRAEANGKSPA